MIAKVSLYIRILRPDGTSHYALPVFFPNGRLRAQYAIVDNEPKHHPEGVFYLRYPWHGKRVWQKVGPNPAEALNARAFREHQLRGLALGMAPAAEAPLRPALVPPALPAPHSQLKPRVRWDAAYREYMLEAESRLARRTAKLYRAALDEFDRACPVTYLDEITRSHFLRLEAYVVAKGNERRTAYGHAVAVVTFLKRFGFKNVVEKRDLPRFTKKTPIAYSTSELNTLFEAASAEDRLIFEFFLNTGFREQEAMVATVRDVDFDSGLISVRSKPGYEFDPKDREEREVPVPDTLLVKLRRHIDGMKDTPLLFPNRKGAPRKHMIRRLKKTALAAGLNCGECVSKQGLSCAAQPVCERWQLHSFRRTFATHHHEGGQVSLRTLADWLGHADIETTLGYLAVSNKRSPAVRRAVNTTFAGIAS